MLNKHHARFAKHRSLSCMGVFFSRDASPSHHVAAKFRKGLPHLINRGAKIQKITETLIIVQDIDEWLWQDAQTLEHMCEYQLINHVYSSVSTDTDGLNGIVLSITIVPLSRLWSVLQGLIAVVTCVCFFCRSIMCMSQVCW